MSAPQYVGTTQVARALGVGVSTVKRWVDEGVLPAHRTAGGHRKLLLADVLRVARENDLPRADLSLLGIAPAPEAPASTDPDPLAQRLTDALRRGDGDAVRATLHGAYHAGLAIETLADSVIMPAMQRIGHDWETGRIDVLHEHRGTHLCTSALYELKGMLDDQAPAQRPVAIGGAPERDYSVLASLLAEMVLIDAGWRVVNLGPHTPLASLRKALAELRPRLLWLSVSHLYSRDQFLAEYRELYRDAERAGVAVAVGGRALSKEVRSTMPYTTYGDGLRHLAAFAHTLHPPTRPPRRGRPPQASNP